MNSKLHGSEEEVSIQGNGASRDFRLDFRSDEKRACFSSAEGVSEQFLRFRPPIIPRKPKNIWKKRTKSSFFVSDKIWPYQPMSSKKYFKLVTHTSLPW
jgi:hypothetical protein